MNNDMYERERVQKKMNEDYAYSPFIALLRERRREREEKKNKL
jgi:hypothetical protein